MLLVPADAQPDAASARAHDRDPTAHYRALASRAGVNAAVCLCLGPTTERAFGLIPKDAASPLVIGGRPGHWFWPSAEERLMRDLVRLGYHVVFVEARPD